LVETVQRQGSNEDAGKSHRAKGETVRLESTSIVDHSSPVPFYFQLGSYIERQIKDHHWTAGQLLPSEEELCAAVKVSRTVVRQAIAELEQKGLVQKKSGKRSSIALPKYEGGLMQSLSGFYDDALAMGQQPSTKVLALRVIAATAEIATALELEEGASVIELSRLRFLDDQPEVLVATYLPYSLCPDLMSEDLSNNSLYRLLAGKYGLRIARGTRTIKAIALDRDSAKMLGVRTGSPALRLKSIGLLENGTPLEYFIAIHRGDRAEFSVELVTGWDSNSVRPPRG
jgi:GntR family transcriptional regulator